MDRYIVWWINLLGIIRFTLNEMYTEKNSDTQLFSFIVLFLWGISIGIVCYLSLTPEVEFPLDFTWADGVYHSLAYLWLSSLPFIGFRSVQSACISALLMIPLGIGLEFCQNLVPGRFFSIPDMIANSFGVLVGIVCGLYLRSTFMSTEILDTWYLNIENFTKKWNLISHNSVYFCTFIR